MKIDKKIADTLSLAQEELSSFFGVEINQPAIVFLNSRQEIDDYWKKKTDDWFSAWAKDKTIFILNPDIYTTESSHKNIKHFWQTLKHEYCHMYFRKVTHGSGCSKWLNEGLACYLAGQEKKEPTLKEKIKVFDYYLKGDWQIYAIGYFWVKFLIERFGKEKLLKLIKTINLETDEKKFSKQFYDIYGFNYSKEEFKKILS